MGIKFYAFNGELVAADGEHCAVAHFSAKDELEPNASYDEGLPPRATRQRRWRANPTGTASEAERLIFIAGVVALSKTMLAQGGPKALSPIRLILRNVIYCFWEEREFKRFHERRPRSKAAAELPDGELIYDHAIPISLVTDKLLAGSGDLVEVRSTLEAMVCGCLITREEDRILTAAGLRDRLPAESDPHDQLARYRSVGIEIHFDHTPTAGN